MRGLSIDLEDWFQVYNFSKIISFDDWDKQEHRLEKNTHKVLDILDANDTKATFFVLGWNAERFPSLIKEIHKRGHEIASHGYSHRLVYHMSPEEFADDLDKSIKSIKNACGVKPIGYRAPSFSIVKKNLWALDILKEKGFEYDSSMVPIKHPDYGIKGIPNKPFSIRGIKEIPLSTTYGLPVGGGYFRTYPYFLTKHLLKQNKHAVFYIHPWEFDPGMPRHNLPLMKKFRHYNGLSSTEGKFRRLVEEVGFERICRLV